ncbi:MAG: hypothetical protein KME21_24155 [Desmonostoc vinosum HA7617-LM4]|jgi:hypothetical protein|nr:hypothetical protein [Desmonostoc vinosum HA7617-LM4]
MPTLTVTENIALALHGTRGDPITTTKVREFKLRTDFFVSTTKVAFLQLGASILRMVALRVFLVNANVNIHEALIEMQDASDF